MIKRKRQRSFRILFLLTVLPCALSATPFEKADALYAERQYLFASFEYKSLLLDSLTARQKLEARLKYSLSQIRLRQYSTALELTENSSTYPFPLLSLYSALRSGRILLAQEINRKTELGQMDVNHRQKIALFAGSLFLEDGRLVDAGSYYARLAAESEEEIVRQKAGFMQERIALFQKEKRKIPWLAGLYSALLPGSGQLYARHEADGLIAFSFNFLFLGSAALLYQMEQETGRPHAGSAVMGLCGIFFYVTNINGAVASARRYNIYRERLFHNDIRREILNADLLEQMSDLRFKEK